jgi:hypothetical protein
VLVVQARQVAVRQVLVQTQFFLVLPQQVVVGVAQKRLHQLCQQQVALVVAVAMVKQARLEHLVKGLLAVQVMVLLEMVGAVALALLAVLEMLMVLT